MNPWGVLATVMVGTVLVGLDRTIINLAINDVRSDFDLSLPTAGWLATAYLITDSVFIPVFGKLGDLIGDRRVYVWGMWGFLVTSLLCGLAWSYGVLVAFRALQGMVGAAVFPTSLALITRSFTDPGQRAQAFGIWSASFAISIALGPLIGGPLIDALSWRWIFYINFPITVIGLFMAYQLIAPDRGRARLVAFDWQGAMLLGASLTAAILAVERGREWGWTSSPQVACYLVTVLAMVWFLAWESSVRMPMIDLSLFRSRVLSLSLLVSFISFIAMVGIMFLLPVFAQSMLDYTATKSGLLLLPFAVGLTIAAPIATKLTEGLSLRVKVGAGLLVAAGAVSLLGRADVRSEGWELGLPLALVAVGLAPSFAALTLAATTSAGEENAGVASGILNLVRNMGASVGIAVFATMSETLFESNLFDLSESTLVNPLTPPISLPTVTGLVMAKSQLDAYAAVFTTAALVMVLAAATALLFGRARETMPAASPQEAGA